ncbi:MAG TPA: hypothetical protein VIN57_03680 [Magnetovibrio sp.]
MRIVMFAATALLLSVSAASATDLLNQDADAHMVTVTTAEGSDTIEIAPSSEVMDVCHGCTLALENGEPVDAMAADVVMIIDGALSIQE